MSMELVQQIFDWSEKQPLWRRDVMRRLALTPALDSEE
jgi:hypothetical protein